MGEVVQFPTIEGMIVEELEALLEAAKAGVFTAFCYVYEDIEGNYVVNWVGDVDEPDMLDALQDLRRRIKAEL